MPRNPEVDAWFAGYEHPSKDVMLRGPRDHPRGRPDDRGDQVEEPDVHLPGNPASLDPRTKAHVSLMFHTGATIPGDHPRLEGGGEVARYMRFAGMAEAAAGDLRSIVAAWCDRPQAVVRRPHPGTDRSVSESRRRGRSLA